MLTHCNCSPYLDFASTEETGSSTRKRKLSTGEGEDVEDNYTETEEVIVYVTEPDVGGSESPVKAAGIAGQNTES